MKLVSLKIAIIFSLLLNFAPLYGYELGGRCIENGDFTSLPFLWNQYENAIKANDYRTAIEIRKKIILVSCDNANFWEGLPELHLQLKDIANAIGALEEMYLVRHFEIVDQLFDTVETKDDNECSRESKRLYATLKETEEFKQSKLAFQIKHNREEYTVRHKQLVEKYQMLSTSQKPASIHVTYDACPGEGCQFGIWTAKKDTPLYDKPKGKKIIKVVKNGQQVEAVTGQVYVRPLPVGIIHNITIDNELTLHTSDLIFELESVGEGACRYWKNGKEFVAELSVRKYCPFPGTCHAEYIFPDQIHNLQTWWVKIRAGEELFGWTKERSNFSGTGAFE